MPQMLGPLDEYPLHQLPQPIAWPGSSDRNFYDRSYFNAHDRTGNIFLITGIGYYPNLGVKDAFVLIRRADIQTAVHLSDAIDSDRLHQHVNGYRVEVVEPLRKLRIVLDETEGVAADLTWEGLFDVVQEQPHVLRSGNRVTLDAQRFAQLGTWSGRIVVDGERIAVDPATWLGSRDRSWGIRPVGEPEPGGGGAPPPPPPDPAGWPRLDWSMDAALLLAALASRAGDHVDFLAHDRISRAGVFGASRSELLAQLVDAMAPLRPALIESDWHAMIATILRRTRRRSLVVLLTDLNATALDEGLLPVLPQLSARHHVLVAAVADPRVDQLAAGRSDAAAVYDAAAAERARNDRRAIASQLRRGGVDVIDAPPAEIAPGLADRYLAMKATGRL